MRTRSRHGGAERPAPRRTRSIHFVISGALGGLVGFALMELVFAFYSGDGSRLGIIFDKGLYFAGFGLAVGAALGMTEGVVRKHRRRLWYGLVIGLLLGALGGFAGGALGQAVYGLAPVRYAAVSNADVVVVLDSSGSMKRLFFFGSDPWGERRKAAKRLVERLSTTDRVAVVDFDGQARVLFPLTALGSSRVRRAAKAAIDRVDDRGGTHLTAGLHSAIEEISRKPSEGRERHVIFLTDGRGAYDPAVLEPARGAVRIHTVGLGSGVDAGLLAGIARQTGGRYYSVADAGDLIAVFEKILTENLDLTESRGEAPKEASQLTHPTLLRVLRILGWGIVGLALGLGQGVRENTREDLRACGLGGFLGVHLGGALFDPVSEMTVLGAGMAGRALADVVVGASIGGTLRLVQATMVEASGKPTTTLLSILPRREMPAATSGATRQHRDPPRPAPAESRRNRASRSSEKSTRESLASYRERYEDRSLALAKAYEAGHSLGEIARHFGVSTPAVRRAANRHGVRKGARLRAD